ncbi:hypothetical protein EVAR_27786_1 [Eumeta japonica]|uniref:Uncharacterized protein n=1 Tax=Eumeta variegata TaxID=151549 RepID=A0A4C1VD43_EUMVA|nr:hypothetical protein EVAR_27786_1 [Eumeta japonica]
MEQNTSTEYEVVNTIRRVRSIQPSRYEAAGAARAGKTYWRRIFDEIDVLAVAPTAEAQSQNILEVLPRDLYHKVCKILRLPIIEEIEESEIRNGEQDKFKAKHIKRTPLLSYRQTIEIERDLESDTEVEVSPRDPIKDVQNVHYELLRKPEREQITWPTRYLQPERDEEKTLVRRADDVTDRIVNEFCGYMKELGGDQQSQLFTPKAIKELFQIEFDKPVARGLRVIVKELPSVPDAIADAAGHPEECLGECETVKSANNKFVKAVYGTRSKTTLIAAPITAVEERILSGDYELDDGLPPNRWTDDRISAASHH